MRHELIGKVVRRRRHRRPRNVRQLGYRGWQGSRWMMDHHGYASRTGFPRASEPASRRTHVNRTTARAFRFHFCRLNVNHSLVVGDHVTTQGTSANVIACWVAVVKPWRQEHMQLSYASSVACQMYTYIVAGRHRDILILYSSLFVKSNRQKKNEKTYWWLIALDIRHTQHCTFTRLENVLYRPMLMSNQLFNYTRVWCM